MKVFVWCFCFFLYLKLYVKINDTSIVAAINNLFIFILKNVIMLHEHVKDLDAGILKPCSLMCVLR